MVLLTRERDTFLIPGPAGELELALTPHAPEQKQRGLAIVCHPHPLFGGTMQNKVVSTMARTFSDAGWSTIRFNFRGVGKSTGVHDEGNGELDDLLTVVSWMRENMSPTAPLLLAGFSFGGWIAVKAALELPVSLLVTVAPQVTRLEEEDLTGLTCPWILIQGDQDEIVSAKAVYAFAESLAHPPHIIRMPDATHFFHGQLMRLREILYAAINENHSQ